MTLVAVRQQLNAADPFSIDLKHNQAPPYSYPRPNISDSAGFVHAAAAAMAADEFSVGDTVWAKVRGYPHWPAKVTPTVLTLKANVSWHVS